MAPKASTDRPYGLSEAEMKACICVLRLLAIDGNVRGFFLARAFNHIANNGLVQKIPIDKVALAKLTGHDKPNSAVKIW